MKDKCPFCDFDNADKQGKKINSKNSWGELYLYRDYDKSVEIRFENPVGFPEQYTISAVNFCPICGRKL